MPTSSPPTAGESSSGFDSAKNLIDEMLTKAKAKQIFSSIPHLAEGGFVKEPTLALIGEAGPEVVLPANRFNNRAGDVYNISVPIHVQGSVDERVLRLMEKRLESVLVEATSSGGKTKRIRRGGIF